MADRTQQGAHARVGTFLRSSTMPGRLSARLRPATQKNLRKATRSTSLCSISLHGLAPSCRLVCGCQSPEQWPGTALTPAYHGSTKATTRFVERVAWQVPRQENIFLLFEKCFRNGRCPHQARLQFRHRHQCCRPPPAARGELVLTKDDFHT